MLRKTTDSATMTWEGSINEGTEFTVHRRLFSSRQLAKIYALRQFHGPHVSIVATLFGLLSSGRDVEPPAAEGCYIQLI